MMPYEEQYLHDDITEQFEELEHEMEEFCK